jgi:hypothetical protein
MVRYPCHLTLPPLLFTPSLLSVAPKPASSSLSSSSLPLLICLSYRYDPDAITTKDGDLLITLTQEPWEGLNFRSGMLQSWNKFCFRCVLQALHLIPTFSFPIDRPFSRLIFFRSSRLQRFELTTSYAAAVDASRSTSASPVIRARWATGSSSLSHLFSPSSRASDLPVLHNRPGMPASPSPSLITVDPVVSQVSGRWETSVELDMAGQIVRFGPLLLSVELTH